MRTFLKIFRGVSIILVLFVLTISTSAQVTTADVTGTVTDSSGQLVAGATVTVSNPKTGFSRTTTTNDSGTFRLTELPPDAYTITVEATNFSKSLVRDLELNVGTTRSVNIELKPGQVTETVEVTADGALVETTTSDIGRAITPKEIENLPVLNRTFAGLSIVAPEARPVGNFDPTKTRVGNFAINGGDGRQINVNVDGGDNKDNVVGSLLQNFSYESIQEFQIIQHRWTAEQGRAVGGIVNVITKSGTNQFRGSFFANFRDEALRAFDFFEKQRLAADPSFEKPQFQRQEIGGSIGGPIVKDRAFFFFALEKFRERQNNAVTAVAAREIPLIPGSQFVSEIPTPYNDLLLSAKIDHKISERQNMFYRFSYQKNDSPNDQIAVPANADASFGNTNDNKLYSFVVNHTYNFNPNSLNQFTFHFQDFKNEILGVTDAPLLQFPSGLSIGQNPNAPQATLERKYQFRDDFTYITGNHTFKFGTNYINTELGGFFFFGARGYALTFNALPSVLRTRAQGFATPGNVTALTFSDGAGNHDQKINQLAFYAQDDWKVTRKLTLNLGLRWDANIGNLPDQTNNRTIRILKQLNDPRARAITGDDDKLSRTTPSWTEFQPRIGFAYDPFGEGKTVIRGGYGIFYDQLFQNLTLFSLTQSNPELFQTVEPLNATQLANFRFGVDPLPPVPNFSLSELAVGGFGRINDPTAKEPYIQKFSLGFQHELNPNLTISTDYVHTLGIHEPRYTNINPLIRTVCDPLYGGNAADARCPRGTASRYFDRAFVNAGLPANRLNQINMFSTTNRSLFDSLTTTLKYRSRKFLLNAAYVLASSRAWGGQPTASYSGNGIAITPENQFKEGEFGPTRIDERHRVVLSGVFELPFGFQLAPIMQLASSRPFSANAGVDLDGDGLQTVDRLCAGVNPLDVLRSVRAGNSVFVTNPRNCQQAPVNSLRSGFIETSPGNFEERSGRYFNVDLRVTKNFNFGERFRLSTYADFYNLFNTENLSFASRLGLTPATASGTNAVPGNFLLPVSLYGPGFGPPVGRPFTAQLGFRFTF